jgi:hypothetical protein
MKTKRIFLKQQFFKLAVITCSMLLISTTGLFAGVEDTNGLVLWNGLGSDDEVLNSFVGPNLAFYTGGSWPHVQGDRDYVAGYEGNAVTLKGSYWNMHRVHNIVLNNLGNYLDPEKGSIEFWFYYTATPIIYSHGLYRLFGGGYGLGSGIGFQAFHTWGGLPARMMFLLYFGGPTCLVWYDIANINTHEWVHLAASWDRNGIDGTVDAIRLYVNNVQVAATTQNNWGTTVGQRVDICGGNDHNLIGKFKMDELKIWNYAKTNFFDIPSTIDIDPGKMNLKSNGKWVTGYIELPGDYLAEDIDLDTVAIAEINGNPVGPLYREGPADIGDHDLNDIPDLMVKFDRQAIITLFKNMAAKDGDEMILTVTGKLTGGESFEGGCTITVLKKGKK